MICRVMAETSTGCRLAGSALGKKGNVVNLSFVYKWDFCDNISQMCEIEYPPYASIGCKLCRSSILVLVCLFFNISKHFQWKFSTH